MLSTPKERTNGPAFWRPSRKHDLTAGGRVEYVTTGPEGDRHPGVVGGAGRRPPCSLDFEDGFADEAGNPNPAMPTTTVRVTLQEATGGGTEMRITSAFPATEATEQRLAMGMEEGITASVGQIDELIAAGVR